jgi:anti-anti-sigma factor
MDDKHSTDGVVLTLNGPFGLSQRDRLKDAFAPLVGERTLILDVTRTAYIDSTVLGALLRLRAEMSESGGSLIIAGPSAMVKRLFEITALTQVFDIRETLDDIEGASELRRVEIVSDEE